MPCRMYFMLIATLIGLQTASAAPGHDNSRTVLAVMQRAADWQIAHLADTPARDTIDHDFTSTRGWIKAVFVVGLTALADRSRQPRYHDVLIGIGRQERWQLGPRLYHADDHLIGQAWIWAYLHDHDPAMLAGVRDRFDAILALPPDVALGDLRVCTQRWCWCDALFMAPATWTGLAKASDDDRYRDYAAAEFQATTNKLFDPTEGLFYRDARFVGRTDADGKKIFWARGNGWVYAGLARILATLPADDPGRHYYEGLFLKMSQRIVALQKPDGSWPTSLLANPAGTPPETSATGLFVSGLAYGVKVGLLRAPRYERAAWRGWSVLKKAVAADGKVGWVQRDGDRPGQVTKDDSQPFGAGAVLLAGAELYDLAKSSRKTSPR